MRFWSGHSSPYLERSSVVLETACFMHCANYKDTSKVLLVSGSSRLDLLRKRGRGVTCAEALQGSVGVRGACELELFLDSEKSVVLGNTLGSIWCSGLDHARCESNDYQAASEQILLYQWRNVTYRRRQW